MCSLHFLYNLSLSYNEYRGSVLMNLKSDGISVRLLVIAPSGGRIGESMFM